MLSEAEKARIRQIGRTPSTSIPTQGMSDSQRQEVDKAVNEGRNGKR